MTQHLIKQIDSLLPQTQCRQCSYSACLPYAHAIAESGETINRCIPGGINTLHALATLLEKDATPFLEDMLSQEKPPLRAYIREADCIGCTKCIQACPIDAIVGAAKQSHTVLTQECTGCELCVTPCPVDCIEMITQETRSYQPQKAKQRFYAKQKRLEAIKQHAHVSKNKEELNQRRRYIEAALTRVKEKKYVTS